MCGVDHRLIKRPQPVVVCRRMSGPWPQAQLAWGSGLVGVAAAQVLGVKLGGPVAGRADLVGLDQISLDPLVLVAVELVKVPPGIDEVVGPAEIEVDEIRGQQRATGRAVDAAGRSEGHKSELQSPMRS